MKFLICGDFTATDVNKEFFRTGNIEKLFSQDILDTFKEADRVFVNVECALTEHDVPIRKWGPAIKTPIETAKVLKEVGVTNCGLSNNHIFDYGIKGAKDTMAALDEAGLEWTGFGDNYEAARKNQYIKTPEGKTVAIIAVSDREYAYALEDRMGARVYDEYDTMFDIIEAKKNADFVIVVYHGGKEFSRYPSPRLRKSCQAMAKHGADVVLCQHTHCIGCYENFNGSHILYGQGNFHFVSDHAGPGWENRGLMVMLDINEKCDISFIPDVTTDTGIEKASPAETAEILKGLEERSNDLKTNVWREKWHEYCLSVTELYEGSVKNVHKEDESPNFRQVFAHYLDCEAHCDILRELFPTWNKTDKF